MFFSTDLSRRLTYRNNRGRTLWNHDRSCESQFGNHDGYGISFTVIVTVSGALLTVPSFTTSRDFRIILGLFLVSVALIIIWYLQTMHAYGNV
ncbi:MAG: hypothetical protein ACXV7G_11825 [Halobacteriota archaeon]